MAKTGFIGLGNMGGPMAVNLVKAGHEVTGYDLSAGLAGALEAEGGKAAGSIAEAVKGADFVFTMLPAGKHVEAVYTGDDGILAHAPEGTALIDCSTIDVETARKVAELAADKGFSMLDAPVSGGVAGAAAATLTFMVGGPEIAFAAAGPMLQAMGKTIVHAGDAGSGQAAKICNNMILGVSMIAVSEAFALADRLDLDRQKLFDISSKASGQCWSLTSYCPVPGPVPASPANRDYAPGFTAAMMLKDLNLANEASKVSGANTPMGSLARDMYDRFCEQGNEDIDFSGIFKFLSAGDS
jgi:3-hydroxyisobutyrate dehydrogenase